MHNRNPQPMVFVSVNLPLALLEKIKDAARHKAIHEGRHVPYVELVRESLCRDFPLDEIPQASEKSVSAA